MLDQVAVGWNVVVMKDDQRVRELEMSTSANPRELGRIRHGSLLSDPPQKVMEVLRLQVELKLPPTP